MLSPAGSLSTSAGMEKFVEEILSLSREVILSQGFHVPIVLLAITRDPETGTVLENTTVLPISINLDLLPGGNMPPDVESKLGSYIKGLVDKSAAVGLVFVSESWVAAVDSPSEANAWKGKVNYHPDKSERLTVHVEHRRMLPQVKVWDAEISRSPDGEVHSLGEWFPVDSRNVYKLCDFLPQSN